MLWLTTSRKSREQVFDVNTPTTPYRGSSFLNRAMACWNQGFFGSPGPEKAAHDSIQQDLQHKKQ